jgi:hypothetical protein
MSLIIKSGIQKFAYSLQRSETRIQDHLKHFNIIPICE